MENILRYFIQISLVLSLIPSPIQAAGLCRQILNHPESPLRGFSGPHYVGILRPSKTPIDFQRSHVLEIYHERQAGAASTSSTNDAKAWPVLRQRLSPEELRDVQFGDGGKDVILVFHDRVELYQASSLGGNMGLRASLASFDTQAVFSQAGKLFVLNSQGVFVAGKNQSLLHIPFSSHLGFAQALREAKKIKAMALKVENDIGLVVEYIPKDAKNPMAVHLGFLEPGSQKFISKPAQELVEIRRDELLWNKARGMSETSMPIEQVYLNLPLLLTGHIQHSSRHPLYLTPAEFRVRVLQHGYIPFVQKILQPETSPSLHNPQ